MKQFRVQRSRRTKIISNSDRSEESEISERSELYCFYLDMNIHEFILFFIYFFVFYENQVCNTTFVEEEQFDSHTEKNTTIYNCAKTVASIYSSSNYAYFVFLPKRSRENFIIISDNVDVRHHKDLNHSFFHQIQFKLSNPYSISNFITFCSFSTGRMMRNFSQSLSQRAY